MSTFAFSLGQSVTIEMSGERGKVVGRAEYTNSEPTYLVRYAAKDGVGREAWWAESALATA